MALLGCHLHCYSENFDIKTKQNDSLNRMQKEMVKWKRVVQVFRQILKNRRYKPKTCTFVNEITKLGKSAIKNGGHFHETVPLIN